MKHKPIYKLLVITALMLALATLAFAGYRARRMEISYVE